MRSYYINSHSSILEVHMLYCQNLYLSTLELSFFLLTHFLICTIKLAISVGIIDELGVLVTENLQISLYFDGSL